MMEIQYSGTPTEKDFARMYRLATPLKPIFVILWILFFVAFTIALITTPLDASYFSYYFPLWLVIVSFGVFWVVMPSLNAKKIYKQNEDFRNKFSGVVSEQGITLQTLHVSSDIRWGLFQSALISPDVVLLYQTKITWSFLLRTQFAGEADWQAFIGLVKQNVSKHQTRSSSRWPVIAGNSRQILIYGLLILIAIIAMLVYNFK